MKQVFDLGFAGYLLLMLLAPAWAVGHELPELEKFTMTNAELGYICSADMPRTKDGKVPKSYKEYRAALHSNRCHGIFVGITWMNGVMDVGISGWRPEWPARVCAADRTLPQIWADLYLEWLEAHPDHLDRPAIEGVVLTINQTTGWVCDDNFYERKTQEPE